jgi:hypothetical protein
VEALLLALASIGCGCGNEPCRVCFEVHVTVKQLWLRAVMFGCGYLWWLWWRRGQWREAVCRFHSCVGSTTTPTVVAVAVLVHANLVCWAVCLGVCRHRQCIRQSINC